MVHIYFADGEHFPSVTTVIHAMIPEAERLSQWKEHNHDWQKQTNRAATIGTLAHFRILNSLSAQNLEIPDIPFDEIPPDATKRVDLAELMFDALDLDIGHPRRIEKLAVNKQHRFAGKPDLECPISGVYTLVDLKSSREFHQSHLLQMGGYHLLRDRVFEQSLLVSIHPNEKGNAHLRAHTRLIPRDELDKYADEFLELVTEFHKQGLTKKLHDENGTTKD
jgi:hypothetical protein